MQWHRSRHLIEILLALGLETVSEDIAGKNTVDGDAIASDFERS